MLEIELHFSEYMKVFASQAKNELVEKNCVGTVVGEVL